VLGRELAAYGLPIVPGKEKWVSRYLVMQEQNTQRRIRAAGRLGWFDAPDAPAVFVFPDQVLGKSPEEIVYQPDVAMAAVETLHGQGTLRDWQKHVADPCLGNPMLMFSVMLGLAGPLLKLCRVENGGFHLYGVTTTGKTTAAQVAASVWGCGADPQQGPEVTSLFKWYTTGNALESVAEVRNDMLLTLDEISEVDPHELGRIIYQLAGGLSKGRANAGGGLRGMRAWRLLFFSTGEKSVRQMLSQVGQTQKGGQRVRLPDIPADNKDDGRRAVVQDAHGLAAKDFAQALKAACAKHYGLAGPVFATYLIAEAERLGRSALREELREELHAIEVQLTVDVVDQLPPEGQRVLRRFAVVALAGGRAGLAGVIGWDLAQIMTAVRAVRDRWLSDQGQEHSETRTGALAQPVDAALGPVPLDRRDTPGAPGARFVGVPCDGLLPAHGRGAARAVRRARHARDAKRAQGRRLAMARRRALDAQEPEDRGVRQEPAESVLAPCSVPGRAGRGGGWGGFRGKGGGGTAVRDG